MPILGHCLLLTLHFETGNAIHSPKERHYSGNLFELLHSEQNMKTIYMNLNGVQASTAKTFKFPQPK